MRTGLVAALAAFALLLPGVSPVPWWLDSGELSAAALELGVPHPPGVPGWVHLVRPFAVLPLGSLGFRVALASSAAAAAAIGLTAALLRRHGLASPAAVLLSLWPLASPTFVRAARIAEIYAFGTLLTVFVVWALDPAGPAGERERRRLWAIFAATVAALGFGDLRVAFGPWIGVQWTVSLVRRHGRAAWCLVAAAAAALAVLTLVLAARRDPVAAWGDPGHLAGLWDHLSARSIRESFADRILPPSAAAWRHNASAFAHRIADDLGPVGLAVAAAGAIGLTASHRRPEAAATARLCLWLAAVHGVYAVGINPMGEADRQTGIVLAPLATVLAGVALGTFARRLGRARWAVLPVVLAMILVPPALRAPQEARTTGTFAPLAWALAAVDQVPPGGLALTQSDDLAAQMRYAKVAEALRPDLHTVPAQHLYRPPMGAAGHDPVVVRLHTAAALGRDDVERVAAALGVHGGPAALESAGSGLFAGVPVPRPVTGRIPMVFVPPHGPPAPGVDADVAQAWKTLEPLLETDEDRKRFADGATRRVVAWIEAAGGLGPAPADLLERALSAVRFVLVEVDPRWGHAAAVAAGVLDRLGDRRRAVALARRALELSPDGERALMNLALYLARSGPGTGDYAEAVGLCVRAIRLRPTHDLPWRRLAELLEGAGAGEAAARARRHDLDLLDDLERTHGPWP